MVHPPDLKAIADGPALLPSERKKLLHGRPRKSGHAAPIASGPAGETCGSCRHMHHNRMANVYLKCELMRATWTGGPGTDVRAGDAACAKWEWSQ